MKYFAIFLLFAGLLAERSRADGDCKADRKVNLTLLHDSYLEAVKNGPVPTIELGGDDAKQFRDEYAKVMADYALSLARLLYNRGRQIGEEQIDAVRRAVAELEECCESIGDNSGDANCVKTNLRNLTELLVQFLSYIPGNVLIKRRALPDLPPPPPEIESETKPRSGGDIFVNLANTMDGDFGSVSNYSTIINLAGHGGARSQFNILQKQFRTEILNDLMLKMNRIAVDRAAQLQCGIQSRVDRETWTVFENARDRIIAISNDYDASKNNENC